MKYVMITLSLTCLTSCQGDLSVDYQVDGLKSSKGDWTIEDKESAKQWLINEFDLNDSSNNEETDWIYETIDCLVRRLETHYENLEEAQFDTEGVGTLGGECGLKYLLPSVKNKNEEEEYFEEDENYENEYYNENEYYDENANY